MCMIIIHSLLDDKLLKISEEKSHLKVILIVAVKNNYMYKMFRGVIYLHICSSICNTYKMFFNIPLFFIQQKLLALHFHSAV